MFKPLHQASEDLPWSALIVTRTESVVIENRIDYRVERDAHILGQQIDFLVEKSVPGALLQGPSAG